MGAGHHHHHHHGHHHHHHSHGDQVSGRLWLAFFLNLSFAVIELIGGYLVNSIAIITDALHDFGDATAIGLAFVLEKISRRAANDQYSYGYRRFSTAAALVTGFILVAGSLYILTEAVPRLFEPQTPFAPGMIALAVLGVAVNGFAAWRVSRGTSLNEKMIVWHLLEDAIGWVAVLIGAVVIQVTGWAQVDAILACLLALWILWNVTRNLRDVLRVFLQMVPPGVNLSKVKSHILQVQGVKDLHHLHVWSLDGEQHILTAHIVVSAVLDVQSLEAKKLEIKKVLKQEGIAEATLEFECEGADCADPHHH